MAKGKGLRTIAAANGIAADHAYGAVVPPIYLSSTFAFDRLGHTQGYDYSRTANPSRDMLADTLTELEGGAGAVVVASGMAAIDLVLGQLRRDDFVIAPHDCYAGTHRLLAARRDRGQFDVIFLDQSDNAALAEALKKKPSLVLIETPSNPLMRVVDIHTIAMQAKAIGAKVAVDNTFLSPALQQPIALGADFVIHSTTKYLNGHSDVVGGAVIAASKQDTEALAAWANTTGVTGAPFDAYLTLRGLRTLFPRIESQQRTAASLAVYLQRHPLAKAVHYPGLESHPGHAVAKVQQSGFGAMLSFELAGDINDVRCFVDALRIFTLAESLGGVESLIAHPATMTHASMDAAALRSAGISDTLLRLSVGLEAEEDLLNDLEQAFSAVVTDAAGRGG
ncbi:MAG: cystathionine gamma-synthase [Alphaproteobacteria bacterium]|nr:cystathionine gamma-synthase [Alphaproteobacteria bacterium]